MEEAHRVGRKPPKVVAPLMKKTLIGAINEICCSDGLWWHDIYTIVHDDRFRHSNNNNNKEISSAISQSTVAARSKK
jgi:hypothetical protein